MRPIVLIVGLLLLCVQYSSAQRMGARLYSGISLHENKSEKVTPEDYHQGYLIGLDARLTNSNTSFLVGGQFARVPIKSSTSFFEENDKVDYLNFRIGFDTYIYPKNDYTKLRAKVLGTLHKVFDYEHDRLIEQGNGKIEEVMAGVVIGLGMDLSFFTIDFEYEIGLSDAYSIDDSKFDGVMIMLGFHF